MVIYLVMETLAQPVTISLIKHLDWGLLYFSSCFRFSSVSLTWRGSTRLDFLHTYVLVRIKVEPSRGRKTAKHWNQPRHVISHLNMEVFNRFGCVRFLRVSLAFGCAKILALSGSGEQGTRRLSLQKVQHF